MTDKETQSEQSSTIKGIIWGAVYLTVGVAFILVTYSFGSELGLALVVAGIGLVLSLIGLFVIVSNYLHSRRYHSKE